MASIHPSKGLQNLLINPSTASLHAFFSWRNVREGITPLENDKEGSLNSEISICVCFEEEPLIEKWLHKHLPQGDSLDSFLIGQLPSGRLIPNQEATLDHPQSATTVRKVHPRLGYC